MCTFLCSTVFSFSLGQRITLEVQVPVLKDANGSLRMVVRCVTLLHMFTMSAHLPVPAPCACSLCLLPVPAPCACSLCVLPVRAPCACSLCVLPVPAPCACSLCLLPVPAPCACSLCLLPAPAPCACSLCASPNTPSSPSFLSTLFLSGLLESLQPDGPEDGFLYRFLEKHGSCIHHVTFKVDDIDKAVSHFEAMGYKIIGLNKKHPYWKEFFLFPKQALGIVVQVVMLVPEFESQTDWRPDYKFPTCCSGNNTTSNSSTSSGTTTVAATSSPPVSLLGLRMTVRSADAAKRQFVQGLGGQCKEESKSELLFHFDQSPMYIRVHIDPDAKYDGPNWIEVCTADDTPLQLDNFPNATFGAKLVQLPSSTSNADTVTVSSNL
jgi:hypothetical protein